MDGSQGAFRRGMVLKNDAGDLHEADHSSIDPKEASYLDDSCKAAELESLNIFSSETEKLDNLTESENEKLESTFGSENKMMDAASTSFFGRECCIYRVEEKFHELSYRAYIPDMVSIGPFHRGKGNLPAMEQYKLLYLRNLLARMTTKEWPALLNDWVESTANMEEEARKCYSEPINMNSNEFVEMMLVDGLFIIELFRKNVGEVKIDIDDPFFDNTTRKRNLLSTLIHDLVLLENQLPMLVLNHLFTLPKLCDELRDSSITMLTLNFFNPLMPREKEVLEKYSDYEGKHLLDLLSKTFLALVPSSHHQTNNKSWKSIPSAMEMERTGVLKFKKGSTKGSFLDIKFCEDGVLEIPPVTIQDQTVTLLRNLLAFEQLSGNNEIYMTSYVILMRCIMKSSNDVGFLRNQGIISNYLVEDADVSNLFVNLSYGVNTLGNFYYSELCDQVNKHYKEIHSHRYDWRADLKRYCLDKLDLQHVSIALALSLVSFFGSYSHGLVKVCSLIVLYFLLIIFPIIYLWPRYRTRLGQSVNAFITRCDSSSSNSSLLLSYGDTAGLSDDLTYCIDPIDIISSNIGLSDIPYVKPGDGITETRHARAYHGGSSSLFVCIFVGFIFIDKYVRLHFMLS